jgi:arylsulfatase A-like enzyme
MKQNRCGANPIRSGVIAALALLGLALIAGLGACGGGSAPDMNFILVTLDTQRADHLSSYDDAHASTPALDALAARGILFERCYSPIPITLPAHAAMFFSQAPHELDVYNNGDVVARRERRPSIVEIFRRNDYRTAAFVSLGVLQPKFGLDQGFEYYSGEFPRDGRMFRTAGEINAEVFPWLEAHQGQRFFLWVHYSDPHHPYYPPNLPPEMTLLLNNTPLGEFHLNKTVHRVPMTLAPGPNEIRLETYNPYIPKPTGNKANFMQFVLRDVATEAELGFASTRGWNQNENTRYFLAKKIVRLLVENPGGSRDVELTFQGNLIIPKPEMKDLYRKEVEYMDARFGELWEALQELELDSRTRMLVVGDHGEGLGEYTNYAGGRDFGHINFLYDIYTRVPLILYSPGLDNPGSRRPDPVDLLDVAPTIFAMSGLKPLRHFQGRNLLKSPSSARPPLFQATYRPQADKDTFAALRFPLHLITTPTDGRYMLFDLSRDPASQQDLYGERGSEQEIMELKQNLEETARVILRNKPETKVDDKTREMLKALGYIKQP